jgi:hypothetical protein
MGVQQRAVTTAKEINMAIGFIKAQVDKGETVELQPGVYLQSRESIVEEQKSWSDDDEAKDVNFYLYRYWITTDSGEGPYGYDCVSEACMNHQKEWGA